MLHPQASPSPLLPSTANFGVVIAGQNSGRRAGVTNGFTGSQVRATITDDTSNGSFQILGLTTYDVKTVDPTELPPGHKGPLPTELVTLLHVDGSGPIIPTDAVYVAIDLSFTAPTNPTTYQYTATATFTDELGNRESLPIVAIVSGIKTTLVGQPPVIRQGGEGDLHIEATSLNPQGPSALVYYTLASSARSDIKAVDNWDIAAIAPGASVPKTLRVAIGGSVPVGLQSLPIIEDAYFGSGQTAANQQYDQVTPMLQITVVGGAVLVYPEGSGDLEGYQGSYVSATVVLASDGIQPGKVTLQARQTPPGVTMSPITADLGTQPSLQFLIDWSAPVGPDQPIELAWTSDDGQSGTLTLHLTIKTGMVVLQTGHVNAGQVMGEADLAICWNGKYSYKGHLHDNSSIIGDNFGFAIAPRFTDGGPQHIFSVQGELGALVGPDRDYDWQQDRQDSWIAQNWDNLVANGFTWTLQTSTDGTQILSLIADALGIVAIVLIGGAILSKPGTWTKDENGNAVYQIDISSNDQSNQ